ncbi:MAG: tRNA uridine-5-carboxymethylaminomethyl(34) synthesis GTPase MnmE [Methylocystaceae bacterium]|nr:tRNA uridine-5-carboxymethylaminomethyl(34) synthesis GTPase MnmE [Methylocystaceae bacterium]
MLIEDGLDLTDTIYAIATGSLPSAIAIVRISGSSVPSVITQMISGHCPPRQFLLRSIRDPESAELLDRGLVAWFLSPQSYTGEDYLELHIHGGSAVVRAVLRALDKIPSLRMAEPGEFSLRAFHNGKMDLSSLEGLSDLISAQTDEQRKQALSIAGGALSQHIDIWRNSLIEALSYLEAELDFSDEGDVENNEKSESYNIIHSLKDDFEHALQESLRGEIIRNGISIALIGAPNVGKSTLLNKLAQREVAIVTDLPGTTRDLIEVSLDIKGYKANLFDTAGLRDTSDQIEIEGIKRTKTLLDQVHIIIELSDQGHFGLANITQPVEYIKVLTKADQTLGGGSDYDLAISSHSGEGIDDLLLLLQTKITFLAEKTEPALITRERHRQLLEDSLLYVNNALALFDRGVSLELVAEELRLAANSLSRIIGRIDVEDVLGEIFSRFCIGK